MLVYGGVAPVATVAKESGDEVAMNGYAVVIVGRGPAGLLSTGELALAGIDVALVERCFSQEVASARQQGCLGAMGASHALPRG